MASGKHMVPQSQHFGSQNNIMSLQAGKERTTLAACKKSHRNA
jgi:hypothetical protein